jgi:hypothetical protein
MRPRIETVFQVVAGDLLARVAPAVGSSYHQGTVGMVATLLAIAAEEWDRAASRRIEENAAIRVLFREAAPVVQNSALSQRLTELAAADERDFRVSALEANNCALRAALIDLQSYAENEKGPDARRVEDEIWKELVKSTERRRLIAAPF